MSDDSMHGPQQMQRVICPISFPGICLRPFGSAPLYRSKTDGLQAEDAGTLVQIVGKISTFRRKINLHVTG